MNTAQEITRHYGGDWHGTYGSFPAPGHSKSDRGVTVKADKLASWGFVATAVAFGYMGWRECYAAALAGRHVIILPDNDDEGRDFAQRAAKDIEGQRGTVQIVDLPGLPPKGDIMDWTGTADDLRALVAKVASPTADTFPLADLAQWSNIAPTPKPFVMPGFVPARELTLATGAGGANKSTFGQQLATCVAAGVPMLGVNVMAGKALYITAEDDDDRLHWMQAHIVTGLCSGARIGDVIRMQHGWHDGRIMAFTTAKNRADVAIPMHPLWLDEIGKHPREAVTLLYDRAGKPFSDTKILQERVRRLMHDIGGPTYNSNGKARLFSFHGLRKNAACYLAELGLSDTDIGAICGMTPGTVRHYTKRARALMIARGAADRVTRGDVLPLKGGRSQGGGK